MGCDIHLHVEQRLREGKKLVIREAEYDEEGNIIKQELSYTPEREWREFDWDFEFSDRIYGMFALLADVRNYSDLKHIEIRGFPDDASKSVKNRYFLRITDEGEGNRSITLDDAKRWGCKIIEMNGGTYASDPDYHSPNWCTVEEMEYAVNTLFKTGDNFHGDYLYWTGLLGLMKGIESSGDYECRAVFWFDN